MEKDVVISLFDYTGVMVKPWVSMGYKACIVDMQHPLGVTREGSLYKVHWDLSVPWMPPFNRRRIAAVFAFPPCDHLAVSGARWFRGKGLRALARGIELFATAAEFCSWVGAPYMIENPVSTISSYWRKPDYTFSPWEYTGYCSSDNYNKKTCLWTGGGFVMPERFMDSTLGKPDDRIHRCAPSSDRANTRSATPLGFAKAVFFTNCAGK